MFIGKCDLGFNNLQKLRQKWLADWPDTSQVFRSKKTGVNYTSFASISNIILHPWTKLNVPLSSVRNWTKSRHLVMSGPTVD